MRALAACCILSRSRRIFPTRFLSSSPNFATLSLSFLHPQLVLVPCFRLSPILFVTSSVHSPLPFPCISVSGPTTHYYPFFWQFRNPIFFLLGPYFFTMLFSHVLAPSALARTPNNGAPCAQPLRTCFPPEASILPSFANPSFFRFFRMVRTSTSPFITAEHCFPFPPFGGAPV